MGRPPKKKKAIERAALELFCEKGVDGTSIRDIAERADVTEGAMYRHHKSKDDLVRALFFEHFEQFAGMVSKVTERGLPFRQELHEMIRSFFAFYDDDHYIFEFIMLVRHRLLEEAKADEHNPVELLSRRLNRASLNGEIPEQDVALATQLVLGMVMQAAVGIHYGRLERPLSNYTDAVTSSCFRVLGLTEFSDAG